MITNICGVITVIFEKGIFETFSVIKSNVSSRKLSGMIKILESGNTINEIIEMNSPNIVVIAIIRPASKFAKTKFNDIVLKL